MQNGFCHPDGSFAKMTAGRGLSIEMCSEAVPGCDHLIQAARSAHVPVIFTRYVYHAGYVDGGVLAQKYPEMEQIGSLSEGSWDAEIVHELVPEQGDFVIDKSRYSAFYGTRLEPLLNGLGVRSLISGVTKPLPVPVPLQRSQRTRLDPRGSARRRDQTSDSASSYGDTSRGRATCARLRTRLCPWLAALRAARRAADGRWVRAEGRRSRAQLTTSFLEAATRKGVASEGVPAVGSSSHG